MKIDETLLRRLAGDKTYTRGLDYARRGAVSLDGSLDDGVIASVAGSDDYRVTLRLRGGELLAECDCPVGDTFCKHKVAVALVWPGIVANDTDGAADASAATTKSAAAKRGKRKTDSDESVLGAWLAEQPVEALHRIVLELAGRDRDAWRQLVARARMARDAPAEWKSTIGELIGRRRFRDYRECLAYARRLEALTTLLDDALRRAPVEALALCDHALHRLFAVYAETDDSAGAVGDVVGRVGEIYQRAVQAVRPDGEAFAKAYFKLRDVDQWGVSGDIDVHAGVLGARGIALLEKLAHAELASLPPRTDTAHHWDEHEGRRRHLHRMLEEITRHGGDIDALLAIRAHAVRDAWDYLQLAELCAEHRRERQATEWLERGRKAHPKDPRLLEALAKKYTKEGFPEDALELYWRLFDDRPGEDNFVRLRAHTQADGDWPRWRERALARVAAHGDRQGGNPLLVCLYLAEGDAETAWTLAQPGVPIHIWERLGDTLEADRPERAIAAWRTIATYHIEHGGKTHYATAIDWLRRMQSLHRRLGTEVAFSDYLEFLRQTHRAKRSFVSLLDELAGNARV